MPGVLGAFRELDSAVEAIESLKKQKLEMDAEIERSIAPEVFGVPTSGGRVIDAKSSPSEGRRTPSARTTSSVEYLVDEIKGHKRGVAAILAAITLLSVASIAYYFYFARSGSRTAPLRRTSRLRSDDAPCP